MTPQEAASVLVDAISAYVEVEPKNIRTIELWPYAIMIRSYQIDEDGHKFMEDGEIATATRLLRYRYLIEGDALLEEDNTNTIEGDR